MAILRRFQGYVTAIVLLFAIVSTATAQYSGGTGEPNDPYQIATAADLIALGETPADYDKHFILTADIDLDPNLPGRKVFDMAVIAPDTELNDPYSEFQGTPFTGVFDGSGHTISHLTISGVGYLGLFGQLGEWDTGEGNIMRLGVVDAKITGSADHVGGLVGYNYAGAVTRCFSTGVVSGSTSVGGLVGHNGGGHVTQCYSTASVSGEEWVGGLAGSNMGTVATSFANSSVTGTACVGGLVGFNGSAVYSASRATITNCYAMGTVVGHEAVGGLVGMNGSSHEPEHAEAVIPNIGYVANCYSVSSVNGASHGGGLVGDNQAGEITASFWNVDTSRQQDSAGGTGKTTGEMQTATTFLDAGWDFVGETANGTEDIWKIAEGMGYPRLAWEKYSGGTGEPNDPYQIATAVDLMVLGETPEDYDKHFILTADIDLDPNLPGGKVFDKAVIAPDTDPGDENAWGPVFTGNSFSGIFNGNGHTISHLTVRGDGYLGLFGRLAYGAEVRDLGIAGVDISGSGDYLGGLVGQNGGRVIRCWSTGVVNGGSHVGGLVGQNLPGGEVICCHSLGNVTGQGIYERAAEEEFAGVGGLVGTNEGTVSESHSTCAVIGNYLVGGLCGLLDGGTATDSYAGGMVSGINGTGGLVGSCRGGVLTKCYSTSVINAPPWASTATGGLAGLGLHCSMTACFWDTQTSGQATSAGGTGKTTAEMQTASTFLEAGWDFVGETVNGTEDVWKIAEGLGYPRLAWEKYSGGTGEPNDPYLIFTAEQMNAIGTEPNDWDKHFKLMADIDLSAFDGKDGRPAFNIIGDCYRQWFWGDEEPRLLGICFTGVFDGNGHTISHLTVKGQLDCAGLFRGLESGGHVKNLGVVDVSITSSDGPVGAVVGYNSGGTLTNCYSTGVVSGTGGAGPEVGGLVGLNEGTVTQCYSTCAVSGGGGVGGLVGYTYGGTVSHCYSTGAVNGIVSVGGLVGENWGHVTQCCSTGAVSGRDRVGGLVGCNTYTVSHCYSTGAVSGTGQNSDFGGLMGYNDGTVTQCYSTGAVSGRDRAGGLVGKNNWTVTSCLWDIQTSGQATSAGGTGKTTAEMQTASTFIEAGWDFVGETVNGTVDIWWINEGQDYPRLWWELITGETSENIVK